MGHFPFRTLQQITRGYKVSLEFQHAKRRSVSVSSRLISWFGRWSGPRMAETMDSSAAHQQAHLGQQTYPVQWETYVYGSGWEYLFFFRWPSHNYWTVTPIVLPTRPFFGTLAMGSSTTPLSALAVTMRSGFVNKVLSYPMVLTDINGINWY